MSQRRMFSPQIIDSDAFLDMPSSAQSLYFHLGMRADDDGFVGNPKKIMKIIGSVEDDLKILLAKSFILTFESGIIVIKHWRINNLIRKDWYKETAYLEEKSLLNLKENGSYTLEETENPVNENVTVRTHRLGKVRLGKVKEAATPISLKADFFNNPIMEKLQKAFPNRNYILEFDLMVDWWQTKKKKLPTNISAFKNWLANTKPQFPENSRITPTADETKKNLERLMQ